MKNKKYKVEIPEGYEVDNLRSSVRIEESCINEKVITIICKPIKKELPKTWDEFYSLGHNKSKGQIEVSGPKHNEFTALWKLVILRDHYNDGWKPNYKQSSQNKYYIGCEQDEIGIGELSYTSRILAFKSSELRCEFLSNFRELIETAKSLL